MSEEFDTETIRNAADIVNSMLLSRAYIDTELQFNSINWNELIQDQITTQKPKLDELAVTETIYNNDKNIINIIHSLVKAVDRSRNQHKVSNQALNQKDNTIAKLNQRVKALESQLEHSQTQLQRTINLDQNHLNKQITSLTKQNKLQAQDLHKLRSWANDIKSNFQVELKRQALEIDDLKNKLLDKRNLSSTTIYGIPLNSTPQHPNNNNDEPTLKSNVIYNNNPAIDNVTGVTGQDLGSVVNQEYEDTISNLTPIIESLAVENYKYSRFIDLINQYYSGFNSQFTDLKLKGSGISLPNPSDVIDLKEISNTGAETIKKYFDEMESFEVLAKPLLNNIYKFYHNMNSLIQLVDSSSSSDPDGSRLKQLQKELEVVKKNWKDALNIAENWKNYQQQHEKLES